MRKIISLLFVVSASISFAEERKACVFCEIAAGKIQASQVVYRDESVVAFMSHGARNPGHVLIVPKEHADGIIDVPSSALAYMAEVAQLIVRAIKRTDLKADGFNLQSNTGEAAGQTVFHLHLHVIPRFKGELPTSPSVSEKKPAPAAELDEVAQKLRLALKKEPNKKRNVDNLK